MTPGRVKELRRACENATPGPWRRGGPDAYCTLKHEHGKDQCRYVIHGWYEDWTDIYTGTFTAGVSLASDVTLVCGTFDYDAGGFVRREDADFCTLARTALPELLAEVERLEARVGELEADRLEWMKAGVEAVRGAAGGGSRSIVS